MLSVSDFLTVSSSRLPHEMQFTGLLPNKQVVLRVLSGALNKLSTQSKRFHREYFFMDKETIFGYYIEHNTLLKKV
jgi:hypothetical protein